MYYSSQKYLDLRGLNLSGDHADVFTIGSNLMRNLCKCPCKWMGFSKESHSQRMSVKTTANLTCTEGARGNAEEATSKASAQSSWTSTPHKAGVQIQCRYEPRPQLVLCGCCWKMLGRTGVGGGRDECSFHWTRKAKAVLLGLKRAAATEQLIRLWTNATKLLQAHPMRTWTWSMEGACQTSQSIQSGRICLNPGLYGVWLYKSLPSHLLQEFCSITVTNPCYIQ